MINLVSPLGKAMQGRRILSLTGPKPVLQMAAMPMTLDIDAYSNARSSQNPTGSFLALRALRDLADPVPTFDSRYYPSAASTERVWGMLLAGASADPDSPLARAALADARQSYATNTMANLDSLPDSWRPVYPVPDNWCTLARNGSFRQVTLALSGDDGEQSPFATIGGPKATSTSAGLQLDAYAAPSGGASGALHLKVLEVSLKRPWLDPTLLAIRGLTFPGQAESFISSGSLSANPGLLPLIPISIWLAQEVRITADWVADAAEAIATASAAEGGGFGSLGGLALSLADHQVTGDTLVLPSLQLIAVVSHLVPACPAAAAVAR